jgi:hypothetical protein
VSAAETEPEREKTAREKAEIDLARPMYSTPEDESLIIATRAQAFATLALADAVENLTDQIVNEWNRAQS